jgi:hypothetical protein
MAAPTDEAHALPTWFVAPGEMDFFAWLALGFVCLGLYGIVTLYAAFDRWAEHRAKATPLARTIPTLLAIALLYEIFPLDHFSLLLPLSAILIAVAMDWSRHYFGHEDGPEAAAAAAAAAAAEITAKPEPPAKPETPPSPETPASAKTGASNV